MPSLSSVLAVERGAHQEKGMGSLGEQLVQLSCRAGWKEGGKDPEK